MNFPDDYAIATGATRYATVGLYRYLEPDGCDPLGLDLLPLAADPDAAAALGEAWFATVRRHPTGYGSDDPNDPTPWQPAGRSGVWLERGEPEPVPIDGVEVVATGHAGWWRLHGLHKLYATWLVVRVPQGVTPADAVLSVYPVAAFARGYVADPVPVLSTGRTTTTPVAPGPAAATKFVDRTGAEAGRGFTLVGVRAGRGPGAADPDAGDDPPASPSVQ